MIRSFLILVFFFTSISSHAQLPDGTIAPDFTFTDINGNTQNLYSYLNQGKYVALDISATWCGPCWDYHNTRVMDSLYEKHDIPGDTTWKVFFIEEDASTTSADLHGTSGSTKGDWVTGSNYTIIDPPAGSALSNFVTSYNLSFFPTLMIVCPNKKILQAALNGIPRPLLKGWKDAADKCSVAGISSVNTASTISVYPNPAIDKVTISFTSTIASTVYIKILSINGQVIETKNFELYGNKDFQYDVSHLSSGMYFIAITTGNATTIQKFTVSK